MCCNTDTSEVNRHLTAAQRRFLNYFQLFFIFPCSVIIFVIGIWAATNEQVSCCLPSSCKLTAQALELAAKGTLPNSGQRFASEGSGSLCVLGDGVAEAMGCATAVSSAQGCEVTTIAGREGKDRCRSSEGEALLMASFAMLFVAAVFMFVSYSIREWCGRNVVCPSCCAACCSSQRGTCVCHCCTQEACGDTEPSIPLPGENPRRVFSIRAPPCRIFFLVMFFVALFIVLGAAGVSIPSVTLNLKNTATLAELEYCAAQKCTNAANGKRSCSCTRSATVSWDSSTCPASSQAGGTAMQLHFRDVNWLLPLAIVSALLTVSMLLVVMVESGGICRCAGCCECECCSSKEDPRIGTNNIAIY